MEQFTVPWEPSASPLDIYQREFDHDHWFNRRAVMLWNSSTLRNRAWARSAPTVPTFDAGSVFFSGRGGRVTRKNTADDGRGVNFGSDTPQQIGSGTWVFVFSVDSIGAYTNLWCNSQAGGAIGLLLRINNAGKLELVHINRAVIYTGSIVLVSGRQHVLAVSYNNADGTGNVCIDGRFDTAIAAAGAPRGFTYDTVRLGSSGVASFDGANRIWLAGVSPYTSSKAQLASLSRDPLQLLEPYPWWMFAMDAVASSGYTLTADAGSFTHTGQSATLRAGRQLTAGAGSFSFTGQTATLRVARRIGAAQASYTLAGQDAGLIYSGSGARLTAEAASYGLTGAAAALRVSRRLSAAGAAYVLTGGAATLTYSGEAVSVTVGDVLVVPAQDRIFYAGRQSRDFTVH